MKTVLLTFTLVLCVAAQGVLPGTAPLSSKADFAVEMVEGINDYLLKATASSVARRPTLWNRNYDSRQQYERSIEPNRRRLRELIGAVDPRVPVTSLQYESTTSAPALIAKTKTYEVFSVRWPVMEGVTAAGLLLNPTKPPVARIVAIPDADQSPEMLAGLVAGTDGQFARRLAENGCQILIPVLIDRHDTWSGIPGVRMTNQPHREWIYRMSFEVGRHIIGYEVQKVLAAVDWFAHENATRALPVAIAGYGEGGLLALYSAALDPRIQSVLVSGYFQSRQELWREPVYRDVWGLLGEFGDAELASLIAPRALIIEASRAPEVAGPPPATKQRDGATPNGSLSTPALASVHSEVERSRPFFTALNAGGSLQLVGDGAGLPGSDRALQALVSSSANATRKLKASEAPPQDQRHGFDPSQRQHQQFDELVEYTQKLVRRSPQRRAEFWGQADASSPELWRQSTRPLRDHIWDEVIGRLSPADVPANVRTRLIYDEPKYRGYEVVLDTVPGVIAYGILLVPKDIKVGERRPVVVCQHGLEGRSRDVADPKIDSHFYHRFAVRLAEEGFVTYAPQNPYIGEDRFRLIQRKGHPLKLSLFSFVLEQHKRTLDWLGGLEFVDPKRIGFYGLSYGGKTAIRVPPLLDGYALSICSADFNEWVWKTTSVESKYSYMLTREYDMIEFNFANVVNYSDLANLMAPRPFMVERGHDDGVAPDEWVAYEYAKTRFFYDMKMKMPEATAIEFFSGPHTINGQGTFEFLRRHLQWPKFRGGSQ